MTAFIYIFMLRKCDYVPSRQAARASFAETLLNDYANIEKLPYLQTILHVCEGLLMCGHEILDDTDKDGCQSRRLRL